MIPAGKVDCLDARSLHHAMRKESTMSLFTPSLFLRRALLADALVSGATGLLQVLFAGLLDGVLRIPGSLLFSAGLALLPYAAFLLYLGTRARLSALPVWAVIAGNALWAIDCVLLLVLGWIQPNLFGHAFVTLQAAAVAAFAGLQYAGLARSRPAVAGSVGAS
jgi:hypothetical protein